MGGGAVKRFNPFDSEGTVGRAILTGGLSVPVEGALKATAPNPPPPMDGVEAPPTASDPSVTAAQDAQRRARGRSSTILTGGTGVGSGSGLLAKRTLLGS